MEIRVIESYDAELGYDEEKYYEINSYRNMVVYAQKNKHKQGLEGITLDFDSLVEDLKKKRILIKSEFEDIKESDLKKHYDYFILPDDFINDIIFQLGYETIKDRSYKDNVVNYYDNTISDIEFEQMIVDENNELHWITKCKFRDISLAVRLNGVYCSGGIWKYGNITNDDAYLYNTTWKDGIFNGYIIHNSIWENGIFAGGLFNKSIWKGGEWQTKNSSGKWCINSTWESHDTLDKNALILYDTKGVFTFNKLGYILQSDKILEIILNNMKKDNLKDICLGHMKLTTEDIEEIISKLKIF